MMKKAAALLVAVIFLLAGCKQSGNANEGGRLVSVDNTYMTGAWLSYSEINGMLDSGDFEGEFKSLVKNLRSLKITDLFMHVRAFCDSIYPSSLFKQTDLSEKYGDVLLFAVGECHNNGIRLHAWINPYRVKNGTNDINTLPDGCAAKNLYLKSAENISVTQSGIYLNPASSECRKLIIDGIREILLNYPVDGIHFDDYFYPDAGEDFDGESFKAYCENTAGGDLYGFRRANVNALVSGCYTAIKFIDKNVTFSISPAADINKNRDVLCADIKAFCASGCVDMIIPQLYFGFCYPDNSFCFENLLCGWKELIKGTGVKLAIGLAAYKVGTDKAPDCDEWATDFTVLKRQSEICKRDADICGHVYFSCTSLLSKNTLDNL